MIKIPTLQMWDLLSGLKKSAEQILDQDPTAILEADTLYDILTDLAEHYNSGGVLSNDTKQALIKELDDMKKQEKSGSGKGRR